MDPSLDVSGFGEAIDAVRNISERVTSGISDNAMAALEPVAITARGLVSVESGELRDSIVVSDRLFAGPTNRGGEGGDAIYVGPLSSNVFYAWFLEFGTVDMPPEPFLIPAIEQNQELVFEILGDRVGRDIYGAVG